MQSHPEFNINITIHTFNICESMMIDIVFNLPDIGTPAHHIQGESSKIINPFLCGITSMGTIVHDIKSYRCKVESEQTTKDY